MIHKALVRFHDHSQIYLGPIYVNLAGGCFGQKTQKSEKKIISIRKNFKN